MENKINVYARSVHVKKKKKLIPKSIQHQF